jgi:hypothetical protein
MNCFGPFSELLPDLNISGNSDLSSVFDLRPITLIFDSYIQQYSIRHNC